MSISAGAFFIDSQNSLTKSYSSATFDLTITPVHTVTDNTTSPATTENKTVETTTKYVYDLAYSDTDSDSNTYDVTVAFDATKATAVQTSSGYCKMVFYDGDTVIGTFYTKQIARGDGTDVSIQRGYTIVINRNVRIKFIPLWGTYSGGNNNPAIADGSTITIPAAGDATVTAP